MRILNLADLHLTDLFPERVKDDQKKVLDQAITQAREQQCSHIALLGDIIHDKKLIYIRSLRLLEKHIRENPDLTFIILIGNHDCVKDPKTHGFSTLEQFENVLLIDEPTTLQDEAQNSLLFMPYSEQLKEQLETAKATYLFSHFGLNEAQVTAGISTPHAVRLSDMLNFQRILLGHFHLPQDLDFGENQHLHYVGSTNSKDWNDKNQKKRFLLFDSLENTIKEIFIQDVLEFHELYIRTEHEAEEVLEHRKKLLETGAKVRVQSDIQLETSYAGVIYTGLTREKSTSKTETDSEVSLQNAHTLLTDWVDEYQTSMSIKIPKEKLLSIGQQIYEEAAEQLLTSE